MKTPIALKIALPVLFLCFLLSQDYWGYIFATFFIASLALEIKIRKGDLSWQAIKEFFHTPIRVSGELASEESLKQNGLREKFSFMGTILITLWLTMVTYKVVEIYLNTRDLPFPLDEVVGISLTIFYFLGLVFIYRLFFVKEKE